MITRPLDLASKLRREPRNFDWLFLVNGGLIVLFFGLFGSRYVLAPGLGVDFRLPQVQGAAASARAVTHRIELTGNGQIFTIDGVRKLAELPAWLQKQAETVPSPVLLLTASRDARLEVAVEIAHAARAAGFEVQLAAEELATGQGAAGRR